MLLIVARNIQAKFEDLQALRLGDERIYTDIQSNAHFKHLWAEDSYSMPYLDFEWIGILFVLHEKTKMYETDTKRFHSKDRGNHYEF